MWPQQLLSPCAHESSAVPPVRGGSHPPPPQGAVRGSGGDAEHHGERSQSSAWLLPRHSPRSSVPSPSTGPVRGRGRPRTQSPPTHGQVCASFLPNFTLTPRPPQPCVPESRAGAGRTRSLSLEVRAGQAGCSAATTRPGAASWPPSPTSAMNDYRHILTRQWKDLEIRNSGPFSGSDRSFS